MALEADGKHVLSDVWTSVGVIGGLLLVKLTDFLVFDAVTAIVMAGVILVSGLQIVRRSIAGLMDEADESLLAQVAEGLNAARESGLLEPHDVRAVDYGEVLHVDLHLYMPRFWDLVTTHATSDSHRGVAGEEPRPQGGRHAPHRPRVRIDTASTATSRTAPCGAPTSSR